MKNNVITKIIDNDLCIGCGVCTAVCPTNNLKIIFNKHGKYIINDSSKCLDKCDLCLKACPFGIEDYSKNENIIAQKTFENIESYNFNEFIGYYKNLYVGFVNESNIREAATSGGIARFLIAELFKNNMIDYAIHIINNDDPEKLFKFSVARNLEEYFKSSKSAYYPVEMSEVLTFVKQNEGNYVITALPCFVKGLRSAMSINKDLKQRIKFIFGLTCGQMKTKQFTRYISFLGGINPKENIKYISYRGKKLNNSPTNYFYEIKGENSNIEVFWLDKIINIWCNRWFTPNSCDFCDDIFAELADISFMDAWLKEYSSDWRGTSIVVSRSKIMDDLLAKASSQEELTLRKISPEKVIESQIPLVNIKRKELSWRLYDSIKKGRKVPEKRCKPQKPNFKDSDYLKMKIKEIIRQKSCEYYPEILNNKSLAYKMKILEKTIQKIDSAYYSFYRLKNMVKGKLYGWK